MMASTPIGGTEARDLGAASEPLWLTLLRVPTRVAFVLLALLQIGVELAVAAIQARAERARRE